MPFVSLSLVTASVKSVHSTVPMTYQFPSVSPELLSVKSNAEVHQVLRLMHSNHGYVHPSPVVFRNEIFCMFLNTISDDWTYGGIPVAPVIHILDAIRRTLWHICTCHPNPEHLIILSKILKGMPKIKHPQSIEKCSDCLITKMRKASRGHAPGFTATTVGQGLALDIGFMFQTSKNKNRTKRLVGMNGNKTYCIIYDFYSELIFGVTMRGKSLPLEWLHVLLTRIAPCDTPGWIVCMDLGCETGKNLYVQALFLKKKYALQPTRARAYLANAHTRQSAMLYARCSTVQVSLIATGSMIFTFTYGFMMCFLMGQTPSLPTTRSLVIQPIFCACVLLDAVCPLSSPSVATAS
jgi:hypothetical protein